MDNTKPQASFSKWQPIEIMLALLFLLAPFYYHPSIGGEGLRLPNNITVWMIATIIIGYSIYILLKRSMFVIPKYFVYIVAFPILITLSGFVTGVEQPLKWLFRLLFIWGGFAFFFGMFQYGLKQGRLDRILFVIVLSALMHSLACIAQIWLQADLPFWLPMSRSGMPSGLFQQFNNQATYQVTAIMIAIYLLTRPFLLRGAKWMQVVTILMIACASFLIIISNSTIGILTLIVGLAICIPTLWYRLNINKRLSIYVLLAFVIGVGTGIGFKLNSENTIDKTVALQSGYAGVMDKTMAIQSGYSGSSRLGIYSISLDLIKQQPIFGHGIGSFPHVWQNAKPDFYRSHPKATLPDEFVGHPHNEIIFWIVEGGILAGMGLLAVLVGVALALKRLGWHRGGAYMAMLVPISLHTQVELPFYTSATHWFLFLILLFLVNNHWYVYRYNRSTVSMNALMKAVNITIFSVSMLFLVHCILSALDFKNNQTDKIPLKYAKHNPYYKSEIEWLNMGTMLYSSMAFGNYENVHYVANWAENYALFKPNRHVHYVLLDAYEYLGVEDKYCDVATRLNAIFPNDLKLHPNDLRLQQAKQRCEK